MDSLSSVTGGADPASELAEDQGISATWEARAHEAAWTCYADTQLPWFSLSGRPGLRNPVSTDAGSATQHFLWAAHQMPIAEKCGHWLSKSDLYLKDKS